MRDPDDGAVEAAQKVGKLQLQIPFEKSIERRERLVQQNSLRSGAEDARQRDALLLTARELRGQLPFETLQTEQADRLRQLPLFLGACSGADAAEDILLGGHGGEQRILLEQIADAAFLGRKINVRLVVEQCFAVEDDLPAVGPFDACDAFERHALAAAGRAEQGECFTVHLEFGAQMKAAEFFFNIDIQRHHARSFRRRAFLRSSILTASSTTVEMAMFTMTHRNASASLSVRHI